MIKLFGFERLLLSNIDASEYSPEYRKSLLLSIILVAAVLIFFSFGIYYLYTGSYLIGAIEIIAAGLICYAARNVKRTKNIELASKVTSRVIFSALIALVYLKEGSDFTLIWTIFMPMAIFINGSKRGLGLTLFFYSIVFYIAYLGIDVWQDGLWNLSSYIRLVVASLFLTTVIYLIELSLENAFSILKDTREKEEEYIKQLKEISITDSLTSLYNRRYLDIKFHENFIKADKHNDYFCFFLLDLDDFKKYNDTYGHHQGDEVLIQIAKVIKSNMRRKADTAFRMGGEEFSCLIMSDEESKIYELIEKVKQDIEDTNTVTASFGLCIIKAYGYEDFDEMYKLADEFLYQAKERGKNQIVGEVVTLTKSTKYS